jgi:hypothetical protein
MTATSNVVSTASPTGSAFRDLNMPNGPNLTKSVQNEAMDWIVVAIGAWLLPSALWLCFAVVVAVQPVLPEWWLGLRRFGDEQAWLGQQREHGPTPLPDRVA